LLKAEKGIDFVGGEYYRRTQYLNTEQKNLIGECRDCNVRKMQNYNVRKMQRRWFVK